MARFTCNTCGGRYDDVLADGLRYFHACPPRRRARVRRGAAELVVDLDQVLPGDVWLDDVTDERPDRRDENVPSTRGESSGQVKAHGKGRTEA